MTTTETNATDVRYANLELDLTGDYTPDPAKTDAAEFATITGQEAKRLTVKTTNRYGTEESLHADANRKFDAMPSISAATETLLARIEAEDRQDDVRPVSEQSIDWDGRMGSANHERIELSDLAMGQLARRAPFKDRRRFNFNLWTKDCDKTAVFRTLKREDGQREAYTVLSERYTAMDIDAVAADFCAAMPDDCKAQFRYNGDGGRYELEAILARPLDVAGEAHRVSVVLRDADNGTSSKNLHLKVWRSICTNGLSLKDLALMSRVRHSGSVESLQDQLALALSNVSHAIESFTERWGRARSERFASSEDGNWLPGSEVLRRLAATKQLTAAGVKPGALYEALHAAWVKEPGDKVSDILNAVTRSAHENSWASKWVQEDLEEQAGELLYQRNYIVRAPNERELKTFA